MNKIFLEINRELVNLQDSLITCSNIDQNQFSHSEAHKVYNEKIEEIRNKVNKYLDFQLDGFDNLIN